MRMTPTFLGPEGPGLRTRLTLVMLAVAGLTAATVVVARMPAGADLQVGDPAPAFSLPGSDGKTHTLAEFAGKQAVVLAWFPKAFTGG